MDFLAHAHGLTHGLAHDLNWSLDFLPRRRWPQVLPVPVVKGAAAVSSSTGSLDHRPHLLALAGFERKTEGPVDVLVLSGCASDLLKSLWPEDSLAPLEALRFRKVLGEKAGEKIDETARHNSHVLEWPLAFQNILDDKSMPLRSLKPLAYLNEGPWRRIVLDGVTRLSLSASQIRDAFDLLCDLKLVGADVARCQPDFSKDGGLWLQSLRRLRFPRTTAGDDSSQTKLKNLSWPRGVQARWERTGDQAGVVIQIRVPQPSEWKRLKRSLDTLELGDDLWT